MKKGANVWVEEGFKLFAEKGMDGIKVVPLSKQVGVAKSSFYHYFESPEGFLEELVDYWVSEFTVKALDTSEKEKNPKAKFCSFASVSLVDYGPGSFYNQLKLLSLKDDKLSQRIGEVISLRERYLISLFVEEGFPEELVLESCEILFSLIFGWSQRNLEDSMTEVEVKESLGHLWDLIIEILKFK